MHEMYNVIALIEKEWTINTGNRWMYNMQKS